MDVLQTLDSLLDEWQKASEELGCAVAVRDFRAFRRAFAEGQSSYDKIVDLHTELPNELPEDIKKKAQNLSVDWLSQVAIVREWQAEVSDEMEGMKKKRQGSKKVRKLFTQGRQSKGRNLKGTIH